MKIYLTALALLISYHAFSQVSKGTVIFGGDFNLNVSSYSETQNNLVLNTEEQTGFYINPKVGFYVSDKIILGFGIGLDNVETSFVERDNFNSLEYTTTYKGSLPFANIFMNTQTKLAENLRFNLALDFQYGIGTTERTYTGQQNLDGKIKSFNFSAIPGLYYFLSSKTALVMNYGSFSYETQKEDIVIHPSFGGEVNLESDNIGLNFGFDTFRIGFLFVFNKKS